MCSNLYRTGSSEQLCTLHLVRILYLVSCICEAQRVQVENSERVGSFHGVSCTSIHPLMATMTLLCL